VGFGGILDVWNGGDCGKSSQKVYELIYCQPSVPDDGSERSCIQLGMSWYYHQSEWIAPDKGHVTSTLTSESVADSLKGSTTLVSGDTR
jgi:hypothetical protein